MRESKVMVALRDAEHVEGLVNLACRFVTVPGAELTAIHVIEIGPSLPLDVPAEVLDQVGTVILSRACEVAAQNSVRIATKLVRAHHAGQAIVDEASQQRIDLLILGYHGRNALAEVLLGSNLRYVVHHAPCRILMEILPPTLHKRLASPLRLIA